MIEPHYVTHARQFFDAFGQEMFVAEACGRRPDVKDSLRVLGTGDTRANAIQAAREQYDRAYRALQSPPQVAGQ